MYQKTVNVILIVRLIYHFVYTNYFHSELYKCSVLFCSVPAETET